MFGKEEHKRIETCFDHLDEADSKLIYSWYDGALQNYTTLYDGLWDIICMAERKQKAPACVPLCPNFEKYLMPFLMFH
ncbi:hypothetical protein HNY73_001406 [Argiope bruennichi]|uniref:Uncharacterized protein n=1 Tax=Argiope bruennichi TaxID=94029 RepID=A0A8T0G2C5_ARGBR|nr:hypothetical protein HNY73_001406 [Argiope bruennichi]